MEYSNFHRAMGCSRKYNPKLFSQAAYSLQKLGNETIIIADYEYAKKFQSCSVEYYVMAK